jgi:hypothetical protein
LGDVLGVTVRGRHHIYRIRATRSGCAALGAQFGRHGIRTTQNERLV